MTFSSNDSLTALAKDKQLRSWKDLLEYLRQLPYGRTSDRSDLSLVLRENKGTCSSKHALAKQLADLNSVADVELILAIYKMSETNTPGIGSHLTDNGLAYIPEAHCYLKVQGERMDITNAHSDISSLKEAIISETTIEPSQVGDYKVSYHKAFIEKWRVEENSAFSFDELWSIREKCIAALAANK